MAWSRQQKAVIGMYRRYAGMSDADYRQALYEVTGARSSTARWLTQYHYDTFMPILEIRAHLAHTNQCAAEPLPQAITDWYYWRKRNPNNGTINTRQKRKIFALYAELVPHLDPTPHDMLHYLIGVAEKAGSGTLQSFFDLDEVSASAVIEALKDRLSHAIAKGT